MATTEARGRVLPASTAVGLVHSFASQDWITIGYLAALLIALAFGKGHNRGPCIVRVAADLGVFLFALVAVRTQLLRWGAVSTALIYRLAVMGTLLASFFQLREILPAVSPWAVDDRIYAFDVHVFGVEPSEWLDRFVTPGTGHLFAAAGGLATAISAASYLYRHKIFVRI